MKKKNVLASLLLAGAMFLTACGGSASSTSAAGGVSGSFTGTAKGMGEVSVTLTLTDNVITDCTAKGDEETSGIGSVVIEQFPGEVVEGNTINYKFTDKFKKTSDKTRHFDTLVIATGMVSRPTGDLTAKCEEFGIPYDVIGDAKQARMGIDATAACPCRCRHALYP